MKEGLLSLVKTPGTYFFLAIYFGAVFVKQSNEGRVGFDALVSFVIFFGILPGLMFLIAKNAVRNVIDIKRKSQEFYVSMLYFTGWLLVFMLFGKHLLSIQFLSNGLGFWGLLVIVPLIYSFGQGYQWKDIGITKTEILQNLRISLFACLIVGGLLLFITPGGKFILSSSLSLSTLIFSFAISFGYALLFAAIFEEFFFRAILQTRFTQFFNSELKGILLASIVFGLYHLPFQFYHEGPANGDIVLSLANVLSEQMIAAPVFGILWARTNNLIAPVLLHACVNAISLMPQIVDQYF